MAEAKKTKIDLKARLGKTQVGGLQPPGSVPAPMPGSVPPPVDSAPGSAPPSNPAASSSAPAPVQSRPSAPIGIAPPPQLAGGIPVPPFAQPRPSQPRQEAKPTAQAQTIKVDVGEEIEQERKKGRSRIALGGIAGAILGLALSFVAGNSKAKGDVIKAGQKSASELSKEVKAAADKMNELSQKLADAQTKLENKEFPTDIAAALGGINIPFDATKLDRRNVGGMPNRIQTMLFKFTSGAEDINKTKDSLRNIMSIAQAPITTSWAEEKEPKAKYAVLFRADGPNKTVADLVPVKEPFGWKGDFPANFTITKLENNKPAEKKATRWVKGDIIASDPIAIPVDPKSMAGFTGDATLARLRKAIYDLKNDLDGNKENPTTETPGLIKSGGDLADELHKFSLQQ